MSHEITDIERLALASLSKNKDIKASRDGVVPGKYEVDVTVRVTGTVTVAPDTEVSPSAKLESQLIAVLLLKRMGHSRETGIAMLAELQAEALALTPATKKAVISESGFNDAEAIYKAKTVAALGKSSRRGSVKGALTYLVEDLKEAVVEQKLEAKPRNTPEVSVREGAVDDIFGL